MIQISNDQELEQILQEKWTDNFTPSYVTIKGCLLPQNYVDVQNSIDDFEVFDDDIWICSFPRTGTTWTSEMVWLIANNLDFEKGKTALKERVQFLDTSFLSPTSETDLEGPAGYVKNLENLPRPRFIKTHLPFQLLPTKIQKGLKQPKIIYVYRNPLDCCVSYYYFMKNIRFTGTMEEFCKLFLSKKVLYGDFFDHIMSFWQLRNQPNVLILRYEEMKNNLTNVIQKTATFLEKTLTEDDRTKLQQHLSFDSMKNNPAVNHIRVRGEGIPKTDFIRSGVVGGYKSELPPHLLDAFQTWFKENQEKTGLPF